MAALRPYLWLTLLCALLFVPGLAALPPLDRDESRFMQATKQMLETGDFVHIRFQDEPRNKKPVGIHWLQAATVAVTGADLASPWAYRLPSAILAWLAVLLTCWAGCRWIGAEAGLVAGGVLATCLMTVIEAHIAKTDGALLAASALTLWGLGTVYIDRSSQPIGAALAFWVGLGLGALIKGPIILLVAGAAVAALCIAYRDVRWVRRLRPFLGMPIAIMIVLPWLLAISSDAESSFINDAIRQDIWPKLVGGQETHGALPGVHTLSALATLWPWSAIAPFVLVAAWGKRASPLVRFCLAWLLSGWLAFELVPTKLPHYTLPLFPAFALLTAAMLADAQTFARLAGHRAGLIYRGLWALASVAAAAGMVHAAHTFGDGSLLAAIIAGSVLAAAGLFVAFRLGGAGPRLTVLFLTGYALVFGATTLGFVAPRLPAFAVSSRVAEAVARHPNHSEVIFGGYHEPSAVFLLGTQTRLTSIEAAVDQMVAHANMLGVITHDELTAAQARVSAHGKRLEVLEQIEGFEYSRGRWVRLALVAMVPLEPKS